MPMARGQKFLVGCLAVFGAVLIIVVVTIALFVSWIKTPGVPLEGAHLVDPATAVYAEMRLRTEDPGARELVRALLSAARRPDIPSKDQVAAPVAWILGSVPQRDASDKEVDRILPIVVILRREEGEGGMIGQPLLAISFSHLGNAIRLLDHALSFTANRRSNFHKETYGPEEIFTFHGTRRGLDTDLYVSFVGTDVLAAREPGAVKAGIDTLTGAAAGAEAGLLSGRPADSFLYLSTKPGYTGAAIDTLSAMSPSIASFLEPLVKGGGATTLWAKLKTADILEGELVVRAADEDAKPSDSAVSGKMTLMVGSHPLDVMLTPEPPRPGVQNAWTIRIEGIEKAAHFRIESDRKE